MSKQTKGLEKPKPTRCNCAGCNPAAWPETNGWRCADALKRAQERNTFPDLQAEKLLMEAYAMNQRGWGLMQISGGLSGKYSAQELADALAAIATMFNWKRL